MVHNTNGTLSRFHISVFKELESQPIRVPCCLLLSQLAVSTSTVSGTIIGGWLPKTTWIRYDAGHHRYRINAVLQLQTAVSCAAFSFSTSTVNRSSTGMPVHKMIPLFSPPPFDPAYTVLLWC